MDLLCNTNYSKDLFLQKTVKPIVIHKNLHPLKPIIKGAKPNPDLPKQSVNFEESNDFKVEDNVEKRRSQNLIGGTIHQPRPQSSDNKNNVQIITKNVNNFITNNINNIIISPNFKTFQEFLEESKNNNNVNHPNDVYKNIQVNPNQVVSYYK
jgi:hypothetical protein